MRTILTLAALLFALPLGGCDRGGAPSAAPLPNATAPSRLPASKLGELHVTFAAFSSAREVYESRLLAEFQSRWKKAHQRELRFEQSYGGSGSQARAVVNGLEADIVALSLDQDVELLVQAELVRPAWKSTPRGALVASSIVVIAVRKGNPLGIHDWSDLARPGVRIVNADPLTSGAGRWNLSAIYGAALRGRAGVPARDPAEAQRFLLHVLGNVTTQAKDADTSFKAFASGEGDLALASESQVNRSRMFGNELEAVIPASTLRIDNPVAVVDTNADKHGLREVAEAFIEFLTSADAQRSFAFYGFRPADPTIAQSYAQQFPTPQDLFTIDDVGGWGRISQELFAPGGVVERAAHAGANR